MERNSLFLFLFMMFVWAGLCSAQTTGDKFVLIDGCFFNGMPPGVRNDEGAQMIMLTDEKGHTTREGVFASGDVVTGANTVVHAVAYAKVVADSIEEYCNNN